MRAVGIKHFSFGISWVVAALLSVSAWAQSEADSTYGKNEVPEDVQSITQGRTLFAQHCTVCHQVGKQVIGPALASVHNRRPVDWLVRFIQNSQRVILDEEDEYAQYLYGQYEQQVMPDFEFLSRNDILDILAYVRAESIGSTTSGVSSGDENTVAVAQQGIPDQEATKSAGASTDGSQTMVIILSVAVLLLLVAVIILAVRGRTEATT